MSETALQHPNPTGFAHQFEELGQQRDAGRLGMWIFLATEILFFGGMFTAYTIYRALHLAAFETGSHLLEVKFGATNTAVLICSSLTMAMAIRSAQTGKSKSTAIFYLILTMILGAAFIGVKLWFEWRHDYMEGIVPGLHSDLQRPVRCRRADVHVLLFLHDGLARAAHGRRVGDSCGAGGDGCARPIFLAILRAS